MNSLASSEWNIGSFKIEFTRLSCCLGSSADFGVHYNINNNQFESSKYIAYRNAIKLKYISTYNSDF